MRSKPPKLAIFDTYKTKSQQLTGEAIRQRFIIITLATQSNPIEKTRISISKSIANESQTIWKNLYSGIFLDLDEVLIPLVATNPATAPVAAPTMLGFPV